MANEADRVEEERPPMIRVRQQDVWPIGSTAGVGLLILVCLVLGAILRSTDDIKGSVGDLKEAALEQQVGLAAQAESAEAAEPPEPTAHNPYVNRDEWEVIHGFDQKLHDAEWQLGTDQAPGFSEMGSAGIKTIINLALVGEIPPQLAEVRAQRILRYMAQIGEDHPTWKVVEGYINDATTAIQAN